MDITNSVTKTFLTTVVGLAWQKGLIHDVNDYARDYMPADVDLFEAPHNQTIKWDHLLRQTSDWQGTLWGKPDWADRPDGRETRGLAESQAVGAGDALQVQRRARERDGAARRSQVWRKSLPDVLREEVMEPIGASSTWRWYRLRELVGRGGRQEGPVGERRRPLGRRHVHQLLRHGPLRPAVPAQRHVEGSHDRVGEMDPDGAHAGVGQHDLRLRELVSEHRAQAAARRAETAVRFVGNGSNIIYIDWENDVVAVFRWIRGDRQLNEVIAKVIASMKTPSTAAAPAVR